MKKIERRVSAIVAAALSGVITMLGFSGCKTHKAPVEVDARPSIGTIKVMYGVPSNFYKVSGTVKGPDGKPLSDATVQVLDSAGEVLETVKTGYDGLYYTNYLRLPGDLKVVVTPADDSLAGDSTIVSGKKLLSNRRAEVNFKLKKR